MIHLTPDAYRDLGHCRIAGVPPPLESLRMTGWGVNTLAWVPAGDLGTIEVGLAVHVEAGRFPIAVCRLADGLYAISDTCTHMQASLSEGSMFGDQIEYPRHGGRFNVRTGAATRMPAVRPVATFPVRVKDGQVLVQIPD